nr:HepT-like ribonuclease domain-containing protein [Methanofollis sp. W23]
MLNTDLRLGVPGTDEDIVDHLIRHGVLSRAMRKNLKAMKGFRTIHHPPLWSNSTTPSRLRSCRNTSEISTNSGRRSSPSCGRRDVVRNSLPEGMADR